MSRRAARLLAVEVLYGAGVRGVEPAVVLDEREDAQPYARHLVTQVSSRGAELDALIHANAADWPLERMSQVDRNVLRVGVLELLESDVPPAAVIDEAVEVAKRYSGSESGRFVNGVLSGVLSGLSSSSEDGSSV